MVMPRPPPAAPPPHRPAVGAAVMAYGFYKVGQSNRERRGIKAEHFSARGALVPFLQACGGRVGAGTGRCLHDLHDL